MDPTTSSWYTKITRTVIFVLNQGYIIIIVVDPFMLFTLYQIAQKVIYKFKSKKHDPLC